MIFGAGGLGQHLRDIALDTGAYAPVAYLDSDPARHGRAVGDLRVWGGMEQVGALRRAGVRHAVVAIGENATRARLARELEQRGLVLASLRHPSAQVAATARVESHVMLGPRAIVCANVQIGRHCILSAGALADHDCVLGEAVYLHPAVRLAGGVRVDDCAMIEIGAAVIPGRCIGRGARVGAGTVVIRDVAPRGHVAGVPGAPVATG